MVACVDRVYRLSCVDRQYLAAAYLALLGRLRARLAGGSRLASLGRGLARRSLATSRAPRSGSLGLRHAALGEVALVEGRRLANVPRAPTRWRGRTSRGNAAARATSGGRRGRRSVWLSEVGHVVEVEDHLASGLVLVEIHETGLGGLLLLDLLGDDLRVVIVRVVPTLPGRSAV
jgi:hypothetical protein